MIQCSFIFPTSGRNSLEVLSMLRSVSYHTRYLPGCLRSELWSSVTEPGQIFLQESWDGMDHLSAHLKSDTFRRVLLAMELCDQQPSFRITECGKEWGLELLEDHLLRPSAEIKNDRTPGYNNI